MNCYKSEEEMEKKRQYAREYYWKKKNENPDFNKIRRLRMKEKKFKKTEEEFDLKKIEGKIAKKKLEKKCFDIDLEKIFSEEDFKNFFWRECLNEKYSRKDFEKKTDSEKFTELYDDIEELWDKIDNKECDAQCDENKEKIMENQKYFEDFILDVRSEIANLEEKMKIMMKILNIEDKVETEIKKEEEKRMWRRVCMLTSGKPFNVNDF